MKKYIILTVLIILCISTIAYVDLVIRPGYLIKTLVKAPIFFFIPIIFSYYFKDYKPFKILKINKKGLFSSLTLGIVLYVIVMIFYFIFYNFIDLNTIRISLENNLGININNFIYIALYVCIINSFLEEWFFRGFIYNQYKVKSNKFAYIISSLFFSVYHIAIMDGMFNLGVFLIILLGLFIGGLIFCYINEKHKTIYHSWFSHAFVNLAMNTIGIILFF